MRCPKCSFRFTVHRKIKAPTRNRILHLLITSEEGLTYNEIAQTIGLHKKYVGSHLHSYEGAGIIRRNGYKKVEFNLPNMKTRHVTRWVITEFGKTFL